VKIRQCYKSTRNPECLHKKLELTTYISNTTLVHCQVGNKMTKYCQVQWQKLLVLNTSNQGWGGRSKRHENGVLWLRGKRDSLLRPSSCSYWI
jgi:hypothetical protein